MLSLTLNKKNRTKATRRFCCSPVSLAKVEKSLRWGWRTLLVVPVGMKIGTTSLESSLAQFTKIANVHLTSENPIVYRYTHTCVRGYAYSYLLLRCLFVFEIAEDEKHSNACPQGNGWIHCGIQPMPENLGKKTDSFL